MIQDELNTLACYWNGHRIRNRGVPLHLFQPQLIQNCLVQLDDETFLKRPEDYGVDDELCSTPLCDHNVLESHISAPENPMDVEQFQCILKQCTEIANAKYNSKLDRSIELYLQLRSIIRQLHV